MARRLIIDDATGALYEDFTARRVVSVADILTAEGGATETVQVFLVSVNPQTRAVATTAIATANVSLDIGATATSPTGGKVIVGYGGENTDELPVATLTADSLGMALNRLDAVESDGGVDVWPAGDPKDLSFYVRLQNTGAPGTSPSVDCDGSSPPSAAEVTVITAGTSSERALWLVQIAEKPVASIAESAWSTVTSGSFGGLTASLALNGVGLLAHLAKKNPAPLGLTIKNSGSIILRGEIPVFPAVDPTDLNGSAIISIFPRIVTSTSNPTTGDDSGDGYAVGTLWINTATPSAFLLMANSVGSANWDELTETATGQLLLTGGTMTGNIAFSGSQTVDGRDVSADGTKLDGIEASADVTDATNVTAAGALMDSECAGLAAVKATTGTFLSADESKLDGIEASADVTDATNVSAAGALMKTGGAMTGAITTNSTFDGVDVATRDAVLTSTTTTANAALPKAGGAMTGAITTNSTFDGVDIATRDAVLTSTTSTADSAYSTASYAYTTASNALPVAGGTMTGTLTLGSSMSPTYMYYGQWYAGKLSGDLDANSAKLTGLAEGTANGHSLRWEQLRTIKNDQTGTTYTLAIGDATKTIRFNNASTVTVTVPINTFIAGDTLTLFRKGAGGVTIQPVSVACTLNSVGTRLKLANQYSAATLICVTGGATPEFDLIGDLKS